MIINTERPDPNRAKVHISGDFFRDNGEELKREVDELLKDFTQRKALILDMEYIRHNDSTAADCVMRIYLQVVAKGGIFVLLKASHSFRQELLSQFPSVNFRFCRSEVEVTESLKTSSDQGPS